MVESRFAQFWFARHWFVVLVLDHKRLNLIPSIAVLTLLIGDWQWRRR